MRDSGILHSFLEIASMRDLERHPKIGASWEGFLLEDDKPVEIVECTLADAPVAPTLRYFVQRFDSCGAWQISATERKDFQTPEGIRVCPALAYLHRLD